MRAGSAHCRAAILNSGALNHPWRCWAGVDFKTTNQNLSLMSVPEALLKEIVSNDGRCVCPPATAEVAFRLLPHGREMLQQAGELAG